METYMMTLVMLKIVTYLITRVMLMMRMETYLITLVPPNSELLSLSSSRFSFARTEDSPAGISPSLGIVLLAVSGEARGLGTGLASLLSAIPSLFLRAANGEASGLGTGLLSLLPLSALLLLPRLFINPDMRLIARIACPHRCHLRLAKNFLRFSVLITAMPMSFSNSQAWSKHCWAVIRNFDFSFKRLLMKSFALSEISSNSSHS